MTDTVDTTENAEIDNAVDQSNMIETLGRDVLLLKLRSAIADKEWAIACANMETGRGGWTCDWHIDMQAAHKEIVNILEALSAA